MNELYLPLLFFVVAVLYSSVGHAGASSYLAIMALANMSPSLMKPTALLLNVLVASIATIRFYKAGFFNWRILLPFAIGSVPMAFIGGAWQLPGTVYKPMVGVVLLFAAVRLIWTASRISDAAVRPPFAVAVASGGGIGLLAGLTGTGGGIFLSPVLQLMRWSTIRESAGISAVFILLNSIAGLAGIAMTVKKLPPQIFLWAIAVGIGGLLGSWLGSRRLHIKTLRYLLAIVLVIAGTKLILAR